MNPQVPVTVDAFTGSALSPARRLRIAQHIAPLAGMGIEVREHLPATDKYREAPPFLRARLGRSGTALWQGLKVLDRVGPALRSRSRIAWLERDLIPGRVTLEPLLGRRLVLDVDDAIWAAPGASRSCVRVAGMADLVIAGNDYIAGYYQSQRACRVVVIPTAVDTDRIVAQRSEPSRFTLGWIGSCSNLPFLEDIEPFLHRFLTEHRDARLLVVSDRAPSLKSLDAGQLEFRPWSSDREPADLGDMTVGMMPLPDSDWTRGKCAFKMLLYMSAGIPVIVSPVGMNQTLLHRGDVGHGARSVGEWMDAATALRADSGARRRLGANGRELVLREFSRRTITPLIAAALRSVD